MFIVCSVVFRNKALAGGFEILQTDEPLDLSWMCLSLGDRMAGASLKPAQEMLQNLWDLMHRA